MACSGESWTTPPMSKRTPATRATASAGGGAHRLGRERHGGHLAQRPAPAERAQAVHAPQLFQLEGLDLAAHVAEMAQVLQVAPGLGGLPRLAADDRERAPLGHARRGAPDYGP